jgi:chorismate-pyruvate lyase
MSQPAPPAGVDLQGLLALFPPADYLDGFEIVPADEVPEPYHSLLVHDQHMTVTVEAHHGGLVDVRVLARDHADNTYARKILLVLHKTGKVVQFGIMRIHLQFCTEAVRDEIVAAGTPLGRILIEHDVLRQIKPVAFLRVVPGPDMLEWFGLDAPRPTYGRLAMLHCDGTPAVELLEIVAPE